MNVSENAAIDIRNVINCHTCNVGLNESYVLYITVEATKRIGDIAWR